MLPADLTAVRDEALGTGLLDLALPWLVEARLRPAQLRSDDMIAACRLKMNRVVDWLDARVSSLAQRPFDIGHLSIGVALCNLDFRFSAEDWRQGRPGLSAWHQEFCQRDSVQATRFQDDAKPS